MGVAVGCAKLVGWGGVVDGEVGAVACAAWRSWARLVRAASSFWSRSFQMRFCLPSSMSWGVT